MVHTYNDKLYVLPADAFERAVKASTDSAVSLQSIEWSRGSADSLHGYDEACRAVEKLMRDAIADGELHVFIRNSENQYERVVDREAFRQMSFGIPGFENISHPLTSPGVDTGGLPYFFEKNNVEEWLSAQRKGLDLFYTGAPGKPTAIKVIRKEHQRRLSKGEAFEKLVDESAYLKKWLEEKHPDAPDTSQETIANQIRGAHRERFTIRRAFGRP